MKQRVLGWGSGSKGQLGLGNGTAAKGSHSHSHQTTAYNNHTHHFTPFWMPFGSNALLERFVVGPSHTFAFFQGKGWHGVGRNGSGQLGVGHSQDCWDWTPIVKLPAATNHTLSPQHTHLALGSYHSVISQDGQTYGCGRGWRGQTGFPHHNDTHTPTEIESLRGVNIVNAAAGDDFTVLITDKCEVITFGNPAKLGDPASPLSAVPPAATTRFTHTDTQPRRISHTTHAVTGLVCGWGHTLWLESGRVMAFGSNMHGQCGIGNTQHVSVPTPVTALDGKGVVRIAAGATHSVAITHDSSVYVWGSHRDGKLGVGEEIDKDVLEPRLMPGFLSTTTNNTNTNNGALRTECVADVACSADHTALLTDHNRVFVWGFGQHGALGLATAVNQAKPVALDLSPWIPQHNSQQPPTKVVSVQCALDATFLCTNNIQ
eukprot:TRINITY_DN15177_c0_g1_i1.p1 TRINITY_DN15177_c0_g1~~TRINITY_DN15177_c0_g1_i1.p1  ORF type:complete len:431 (-),score=59.99 TRINITY_DN15177_c0_g1_i1:6-1298(-)